MENASAEIKSRLRQQFRKIRMDIPAAERTAWDEEITRTILGLPALASAQTVYIYISRWGEVSTQSIIQQLIASKKRVLVPSSDHRALPHHGLFELMEEGRNSSHEIVSRASAAQPTDIDLILVPGIVWDREGYRIGFGGGYFDRLLASLRPDALRLGLAFDCQVVDTVPRDPWDIPVHHLVTESSGPAA